MISERQLELARTLPLAPAAVVLEGKHVNLVPYEESKHSKDLFELTNGKPIDLLGKTLPEHDHDALVWRYLLDGPFNKLEEFQGMMRKLEVEPNRRIFAVIHKEANKAVSTLSLMSNVPSSLKIEIGTVINSPIVQRTAVNTEANFLLLEHVFNLGYRRVEWKCNNENERSKSSATRLGFQFEGVQMYHVICKGKNRDTAWFRILDCEWPDVRANLLEKLSDDYYSSRSNSN